MSAWLTLQEYSNKEGVSISTLRRKIKNREVEYTFKNGRYLLKKPVEETSSIENLKRFYENLLTEKNKEIQKIKENQQDLLHLLDFLEKEKSELLEFIEKRDSFPL